MLSLFFIVVVVFMLVMLWVRSNGFVFLLGWVVGLVFVGVVVLFVVSGVDVFLDGEFVMWVLWLKIVFGVLLGFVGVK